MRMSITYPAQPVTAMGQPAGAAMAQPVADPERFAAAEAALQAIGGNLPPAAAASLLQVRIAQAPGDVAALRLLAHHEAAAGRRMAAETRLAQALALAPDYHAARIDLTGLMLARGDYAAALPHLQILADGHPAVPQHIMRLAWCSGELGDTDGAIALYESLGDTLLQHPPALMHHAQTLQHAGRRAEAVAICRACVASMPEQGEAWLTLANLKTEPFSPADIAAMQAQLAGGALPPQERARIDYALGHAFEQAGDHAASFAHYAAGAATRRAMIRYDPAAPPRATQRVKSFFTAARFAAAPAHAAPDPVPIFIVGLPRAGTTLVEQILASHSEVEATRELRELSAIGQTIGVAPDMSNEAVYPECLADLDGQALAALGARYIARTRPYRRTDRPFFIDKMPSNWRHVGLIQLILPGARIIDVRRHPMAAGFAVFKHDFGQSVPYGYDLTEIGRFYVDYADRMAHFDAVLPGRVHRVLYEQLVGDAEAEIRCLLAYCGLDFEPACLRFWETRRAIATPSAEQVRQPIYRDALAQWRHYEPWLGPLRQALGPLPDPWA